MDMRILGKSGVKVSPLGLGCWAIGGPWQLFDKPGGWGDVDDAQSIRAIHYALEHGVNFFDTAANYGAGHSEDLLGQALVGKRPRAVIATKFGFEVDEAGKRVARFPQNRDVIRNIPAACERSLRHLRTDCIDLYQLHVWDYPSGLAGEVCEALEKLVKEGKIRAYGVSTDSIELAGEFAEGEHCAAIQHDLNVVMDASEMLALSGRKNLASVNRSPLARGALTGKYGQETRFAKDDVRSEAWSMAHFFEPTLDKLEALRAILTSEGRTLTQGALAWIWARSERTLPIPGFRNLAQVEENVQALALGPLKADQMQEIEKIPGR